MILNKPLLHLIRLKNCPIYEQLQLEEALLRTDQRNWCLLNEGSPPAIVMGISGKPKLLLNPDLIQTKPIPVIRRFSGGGTVFIDENTHFITFICNSQEINVPCYPDKVLAWSAQFYQPVFSNLPFSLIENDYVLGHRKFGGNAQYLRKDRWLHHSSLLWNYHPANMEYLLMPPKIPHYRQERQHGDFLCCLKNFFPKKEFFEQQLECALNKNFNICEFDLKESRKFLEKPHRQATALIEKEILFN